MSGCTITPGQYHGPDGATSQLQQHLTLEPTPALFALPEDMMGAVMAAATGGKVMSSLRLADSHLLHMHESAVTELSLRGYRSNELAVQAQQMGAAAEHAEQQQQRLADLARLASRLTNLQRLSLECMTDQEMEAVMAPATAWQRLHQLSVHECRNLKLHTLHALQHLKVDLDAVPFAAALEGLSTVTGLRSLEARPNLWCEEDKAATEHMLAEALPHLVHLTKLKLVFEQRHQQFSTQPLASLTALRHLDLTGCATIHTPWLADLTGLVQLYLDGVSIVGGLAPLAAMTQLTKLGLLQERGVVEEVQWLSQLTSLEELEVTAFEQNPPDCIPHIARLPRLRTLTLWLRILDDDDLGLLCQMSGLQKLDLCHCGMVERFTPLAALRQLEHLELSWSTSAAEWPQLASLTQLTYLHIRGPTMGFSAQPLAGLPLLKHASINLHGTEFDVTTLRDVTCLQRLELTCDNAKNFELLGAITSLEELSVDGCAYLKTLAGLEKLARLQRLDLSRVPDVTHLGPISALTALRELSIGKFDSLVDLQPLAGLTQLQEMSITESPRVTSLAALQELTSLTELCTYDCEGLRNLDVLRSMHELRVLNVSDCPGITSVAPLQQLHKLWQLRVDGCTGITNDQLQVLTQVRNLRM